MNYTKSQLIDALVAEWEYLCHDCPDEDDMTPKELREELIKMNIEELIKETGTDEHFTLEEYMNSSSY